MRKVILSLFLLQSSGYIAANTVVDTQDWITDGIFTQGIEGPAVDDAGVLYAVNHQQQGTIGKVTAQGRAETLLTLKNGSIGNGIRFDKQGNMYIADYVNHNVLKVTKAALAQGGDLSQFVTVFAHDNRMDQPNDLAIMDNGILFASDPNWQASSGKLWRVNTNGAVTLLEADMGTTNGIEVSPDNKTLYVNESVQRKVWRYELDEQGNISNKQLFISFTDFGLDGMRTDNQGNLYIARYGAGVVAVVSPQGKLMKEIKLNGKHPTNVAFGGEEGKRLFITMQKRGAIEMAEVEFAGRDK
ncbi:SMP-30/gluconolactonase/LRE family protein [Pseudoalteromonas maricaloris]|uniref:SMP-30/gluconolactonase/LRE family protein n=1 Tax=Pseudoalteromonas maricaloris TaxID=184924 RepID=UPI000580AA4E|nr:SMP-30/gluconolactonase/LRE family protein [Pseudoalteromonas flavipulchra]KID33654.1 gluconolactonase [Pseudoalteromonas flavipulchra NCIMB 2033 = ATCC BAA-314]MBD0782015.1 SMP-30/gluconolactonase/LRE family protein [Pseudoalteromonas flavipulchra]MBE0375724.1 gluconolactonase [Pseudoalteromonas flavipulchra NCIMB 2033 = ATCC BAA-314]